MQTWKTHSILDVNPYVVLKQLNHGQLDTARILLGKNHRNVVEYLALSTIGDTAVVLEEYVKGKTLDQVIRFENREFSEGEILQMGIQICEGIKFFHSLTPPLIHGDIKPENIMLLDWPGENPYVKIIDGDDACIWRDVPVYEMNRGTPGFCAPEQNKGGLPDFSWDIYGLGKTLEFLYLGTEKKRHKNRINAILNKMTATEASKRFVTVSECKLELESALSTLSGY